MWNDSMWEDFIKLSFENSRKSIEFKHEYIPKKLYKYQPIGDAIRGDRLKTIKNNQIWVSKAPNLNDPFDCNAHYFEGSKILQFAEENKLDVNAETLIEELHTMFNNARKHMQVCSFSSTFNNMPLWGNYADNQKGICIEYDFSQVDSKNDFTKKLFPVKYQPERENLTSFLSNLLYKTSQGEESYPFLFFLLNLVKHDSWKYEAEWRYLHPTIEESESFGENVDSPVKPTAIYLGLGCKQEDIDAVSAYVDSDTKLYKLEIRNHEFFHFDRVNN